MSSRWMPAAPLPDKYRLSVPISRDAHPELHGWISSLPQGDIAARARDLLQMGLRAAQMGLNALPATTAPGKIPNEAPRTVPPARAVDSPPVLPDAASSISTTSRHADEQNPNLNVELAVQTQETAPAKAGSDDLELLQDIGQSF